MPKKHDRKEILEWQLQLPIKKVLINCTLYHLSVVCCERAPRQIRHRDKEQINAFEFFFLVSNPVRSMIIFVRSSSDLSARACVWSFVRSWARPGLWPLSIPFLLRLTRCATVLTRLYRRLLTRLLYFADDSSVLHCWRTLVLTNRSPLCPPTRPFSLVQSWRT